MKFFRKTRYHLMENTKTLKYLKYAFGEIVLVVIGILIAVSINNWKQTLDLKKTEQSLYQDLKQELQNDLDEIEDNAQYNRKYLARYDKASAIILSDTNRQLIDTLAIITTELTNFSDFKKEESPYNQLASSSKLELISNKKILMRLQTLAIQYNYINRLEKNQEAFIFSILPKISDYLRLKPFQIMQTDKLYDYRLQNDIEVLIKLGK